METRKRGPRPLKPKVLRELVKQQLIEMNTPRSLSIFLIMDHTDRKGGSDDEILSLELNPMSFRTAKAYLEFSLPTDLVRKATFLQLTIDPEEVARNSFFQYEDHCKRVNLRLNRQYPSGRLGELVHRVRKNIVDLLPKIDRAFLDRLIDDGGWGSGVTSSAKGTWVSKYHKLKAEQHASPALLPIAQALINETRGWGKVSSLPYNAVTFVPKNAKTHRAIAIEPSINAFLQRGVGKRIRAYLRKWGINLHDQNRNRSLASLGASTGAYATIDLTAASDTLSFRTVEQLLPDSWFSLLRILRSEHFKMQGSEEIFRYQKFSSMGNGFTFELETLIFSSIVKSVVDNDQEWCVYGDDIVVPTEHYQEVANLLDHFGFIVNENKSFSSGPFRESCGGDYFLDTDVRGFYLKEIKPETPFIWANWIRKKNLFPFSRTWKSIVHACNDFAMFVPDGDHGLLGFICDPGDLGCSSWLLARRPFGPVTGFKFCGWSFTPQKLNLKRELEEAIVVASIDASVAREAANDTMPFAVSARSRGRWRRRWSVFTEDVPWLPSI